MDFDQHELLALVAPRLLCIASATEDHWCGQRGEWWAAKLASPAWELYGKKGLVAESYPAADEPQQLGCISYHVRTGLHLLSPYDWKCYMDFADRHGWRGVYTPSDAEPVALTVDRRTESVNVGVSPSFAWQMKCSRAGAAQTPYRVLVQEEGGGEMWDSGIVSDSRSVAIKYAGKPLASARRYVWRVSVQDDKGKWADSAFAHFTTGILSEGDWKGAEWISAQGDAARKACTACFTKSIVNAKTIREAYWTVTGLGVFEAYVNGKAVSTPDLFTDRRIHDFLKPGFTHNGKRKHAFTYNVTHLMNTGANAANVFSAEVSASWWRDQMMRKAKMKSAFKAQLILRYADGTEERVGTDGTWLAAAAGPVKEAGIYEGETYDARVRTPWRTSAKGADGFAPAEINSEFTGAVLPMDGPAISLRHDLALTPKAMYVWKGVEGASADAHGKVNIVRTCKDGAAFTLDAGETLVIDFGQNAAAVPEFSFSAKAGVSIKARPAEMLNDGNGAKSRGCDGPEGSAYFANYRRAKTTLEYRFAGKGRETYHPRFTFFGYRYLSVTTTGKVQIFSVRSLPVTSIPKGGETGSLTTGVADVNRLVSNVLWGQYSNYLSVPTDCPQRDERQGWTADTQVFTKAASYNADVYGFLAKWLADVRDSQGADGAIPGIAPIPGPRNDGCRFGWADAAVIVPYTLWRHFGDTRAVEENWEMMAKYVALIARTRFDTPKDQSYQWADWLSYEKYESHEKESWTKGADGKRRPRPETQAYWLYLGGCYWLWDARMMAEMAAALGRTDDVRKYETMSKEALAYLRAHFLAKEDGLLIPAFRSMQTPALFALKLGVVEGAAAQKTRDALLANIKAHGDCLQTGFLGTSILMDALTYAAGAPDAAYTLLLQHKNPSWLYSVNQGATTIWERWNSYTKANGFGSAGMNSFNHYAYGAVLAWMYGTMAGIREDPAAGGFKRFILAPIPDRRVGSVKASYRSPYGEIRSAWRYEGNQWIWTFTIPANTSARVAMPGGKPEEYAAGTYTLAKTVPAPERKDVAEALAIATRGRPPAYAIVLPDKPGATETYAAEELRDHVKQMTDVELPIVNAAVAGKKSIFIRRTEIKGAYPNDAFRIKAEGGDLCITGGKRGVLYGVYEILETYGGCKWYASWHRVVPRKDCLAVPANLDDEQHSAFAMRQPFWYDVNLHRDFAARLRVNGYNCTPGGVDAKYGGDDFRFGGGLGNCHTFNTLLPPSVYFDKHPEYFSLVKGKRLNGRTQLCLTNPDVLRIVTSNVLERIRKDPGAKFYGVSQNDWYNYCECEKCAAVDKEEESHAGTMVRFVNAIAEEVEKEFPDVMIETLAYQYTRKPPKKTRLRRNVVPCLCTIECDFARPMNESPYKENIRFRKDIETWKTQTDQLYLWDYVTEFQNFTFPFPNILALQDNVRFFRDNNVKELFAEGAQIGRHGAFAELKAWLLAKWMWNPELPIEPLLKDFLEGYYGEAAPFIRTYLDELHKRQRDWGANPANPLRIWTSAAFKALDDSFVEWAKPLWRSATAAVKDNPALSYNVRMSEFSFDFLRLERMHPKSLRKGADDPRTAEAVALAKSLLERMEEAKNISLSESRARHNALVASWRELVGNE
ncbi:MAG: family 78 glycoside hydrolase catalytic domain [Kiritimatiellae bacterium]|nr:family 78 glycoside hydrolase catalytic domain [Kiritimatiellia bacterium]